MTILMYHSIGAPEGGKHPVLFVSKQEFADQLSTLNQMGISTVTGLDYLRRLNDPRSANAVWLTFDDGQIDNYEAAFPLLMEAKVPATFFVNVDPCLTGKAGFIPLSALREMADSGMEIGSHTLSHPRLTKLSRGEIRREVFESKQRLEQALGRKCPSFCYPFGDHNRAVINTVKEAGYESACTTIRDNRNRSVDRYRLHRAMVQPGRTGWRFRYLFGSIYHWVHERKNRKRWKLDR